MCPQRSEGTVSGFRAPYFQRVSRFPNPVWAALRPPFAVMVLDSPLDESRAASDVATRRVARASTCRGVASPRVVVNGKKFAQSKARGKKLQFATWNVRSLVNVDGPVETAFARGTRICGDTDDRRIDVVVGQLKRFKIEVTCLQETRWFGQAT